MNTTSPQKTVLAASAALALAAQVAPGQVSEWIAPGSESWATASNWNNGVPNSASATASFSTAITAPATVTLDGDKSVSALNFDSDISYTIAPGTGGVLGVADAINDVDGSHLIAAPLNLLGSNVTATVNTSRTLTISGPIAGAASLTKAGAGALVLTGDNAYTGPTIVTGGALGVSGTIRSTEFVVQGSTGLSFRGATVNLGSGSIRAAFLGSVLFEDVTINGGTLHGPGSYDNRGEQPANFNNVTISSDVGILLDGDNVVNFVNVTNAGGIRNDGPTINWDGGVNTSTGNLSLGYTTNVRNWINEGVVELSGVLTSAAGDLVSRGGGEILNSGRIDIGRGHALVLEDSLLVNDGTIIGATEIYSGARALGSGVFGPVSIFTGGTFSPGNSPGAATIDGRYTWGAGGSMEFEISDALGLAGSDWDLVNVIGFGGFLEIDAGTAPDSRFTLRIASGDIDQALPALNFDSNSFYQWLIVDTAQGVTGFDPAEVVLDTSRFVNPLNGGSFALAPDGDKLFLNFNPVPEPSCVALLLGAAGLLGFRRRN